MFQCRKTYGKVLCIAPVRRRLIHIHLTTYLADFYFLGAKYSINAERPASPCPFFTALPIRLLIGRIISGETPCFSLAVYILPSWIPDWRSRPRRFAERANQDCLSWQTAMELERVGEIEYTQRLLH